MTISYREAGVDIDAGDSLVERIKPFARATRTPWVLGDVGGFAGLCAIPTGIEEPILVSGTDGVGTKLKIAFATGVHDTIGQDLVAMCVNDVITCGARPLFFLDYFATAKLDVDVAEAVVRGIANACKSVGAALLGGETAELPGMYADGEYDLAGFCVGVVGKKSIIDGTRVAVGDRVIGLPSSGLHSNGYSLARRVVDTMKLGLDAKPNELSGKTVGEAMLEPTRLYAKASLALLDAKIDVHAMSHITGGGVPGNLPRVLPDALAARVGKWNEPAIYGLFRSSKLVEEREMRRTFNCGVGYVIIVSEKDLPRAEEVLRAAGESPFTMGEIARARDGAAFEERVEYVS